MSSKSKKVINPFREIRESRHLSREKASELTVYMSPSKIEHIECGITEPRPDEVLCLSRCYNSPELIHYYCCKMCDIGKEIAPKSIHQSPPEILVNILSASDRLSSIKNDLIHITSKPSSIPEFAELYLKLYEILMEFSSCSASLYIWINKHKN